MMIMMEEEEEEAKEEEALIFMNAPVPVTVLSTLPKELWESRLYPINPAINKMQLNHVT